MDPSVGIERQPTSDRETGGLVCSQVSVESGSGNTPLLEVREEILRTQMDDERSDGARLVERIVDEQTACSDEDQRKTKIK